MFKNLQVYRLPANWPMSAAALELALATQSFAPASSCELLRQGFSSPRGNDQRVHAVGGQFLLQFTSEKKLLPASVVNQVAKARAAELEEQQGFYPGRKQMKELKERVADELLPRAFPIRSNTLVRIDPVHGWLVIDAASASRADDVVKHLLKAIDRMPLESVRVARSPTAVMTEWLNTDEAPAGFTIDRDADLMATGESKAKVKYVKHTLDPADVRRHIASGKQVTRLAMTWRDRISFVLTERLTIKSVRALDVLTESDRAAYNADDRFDSDFALMTGELAQLLADVMDALGGEVGDLVSPAHARVKPTPAPTPIEQAASVHIVGDGDDPLYDKAKAIVLTNQRASISLVQRHLLIGYNRAARLMDQMEQRGVISPMQRDGNRTILVAA